MEHGPHHIPLDARVERIRVILPSRLVKSVSEERQPRRDVETCHAFGLVARRDPLELVRDREAAHVRVPPEMRVIAL